MKLFGKKSKGCNFTHAKNMPIKFHENIVVFSNAPIGHKVQLGERRMTYNPKDLLRLIRNGADRRNTILGTN